MTLGQTIKHIRRAKHWRQKRLREATGLTTRYLSEIERDRVDPRLSVVVRIAQALGVRVACLVGEETADDRR